jgi:saposin
MARMQGSALFLLFLANMHAVWGWPVEGLLTDPIATDDKMYPELSHNTGEQGALPDSKFHSGVPDCELCKITLTDLKNKLNQNRDEVALRQVFETVCDSLETSKQEECQTLAEVTISGTDILDHWIQGLDPATFCSYWKLCPVPTSSTPVPMSSKSEAEPSLNSKSTLGGPICKICKLVMGQVENMLLKNTTQAAINSILKKACSALPSGLADQCKTMLSSMSKTFFNLLKNHVSPKFLCYISGICLWGQEKFMLQKPRFGMESEPVTVPTMMPAQPPGLTETDTMKADDGPLCIVCETVIDMIIDEIGDNRTEAAINKALDHICNKLPFFKVACSNMIHKFVHAIVQALEDHVDPNTFCEKIHLCKNMQDLHLPAVVSSTQFHAQSLDTEEIVCDLCQNLIRDSHDLLGDNVTKDSVTSWLNQFCDELPEGNKESCNIKVTLFGQSLVGLLAEILYPIDMCVLSGACSHSSPANVNLEGPKPLQVDPETTESPAHSPGIPHKDRSLENNALCSLCKTVISHVVEEIGSDKSKAAISKALGNVCKTLPRLMEIACSELVKDFSDAIIEKLQKETDPEKVCEALGLCDKSLLMIGKLLPITEYFPPDTSPVSSEPASTELAEKSAKCNVCKTVIKQVVKDIGSDKSKAAISKELSKVCSKFPPLVKSGCEAFVKDFSDAIIQELQKETDPEKVCKALGLCDKLHLLTGRLLPIREYFLTDTSPVSNEAASTELAEKSAKCNVCKTVIKKVVEDIGSDKSKAAISKELSKVCSKFPPLVKSGCKAFVKAFSDAIIQELQKETDPEKVCKALGLCHKTGSKCHQGPKYWCANQIQMKQCKAEEFCRRWRIRMIATNTNADAVQML